MSISIVVTRHAENAECISIDDWKAVIEQHSDLRLRSEPYTIVNPKTGETLKMPAGEADSEFRHQGGWIPFLRFRAGTLFAKYQPEFETISKLWAALSTMCLVLHRQSLLLRCRGLN